MDRELNPDEIKSARFQCSCSEGFGGAGDWTINYFALYVSKDQIRKDNDWIKSHASFDDDINKRKYYLIPESEVE